jgi:hypothetical protein
MRVDEVSGRRPAGRSPAERTIGLPRRPRRLVSSSAPDVSGAGHLLPEHPAVFAFWEKEQQIDQWVSFTLVASPTNSPRGHGRRRSWRT